MAISKQFQQAVETHDLLMVRIMLKDSLVLDVEGKSFSEMEHYANNHLDDLYEEHDGESLIRDQEQWDKAYMNQQLARLMVNFSHERIDLLSALVGYVCADKTKTPDKGMDVQSASRVPVYVGIGVATAGAAAVIAGACASQVPVVVCGTIAVAAGVAVAVAGGSKK